MNPAHYERLDICTTAVSCWVAQLEACFPNNRQISRVFALASLRRFIVLAVVNCQQLQSTTLWRITTSSLNKFKKKLQALKVQHDIDYRSGSTSTGKLRNGAVAGLRRRYYLLHERKDKVIDLCTFVNVNSPSQGLWGNRRDYTLKM